MLYQAPKREITAVAVAKDGAIYAAGVGNKSAPAPSPRASAAPAPAARSPVPASYSVGQRDRQVCRTGTCHVRQASVARRLGSLPHQSRRIAAKSLVQRAGHRLCRRLRFVNGAAAAGNRQPRQNLPAGFRRHQHRTAGCHAHPGDRIRHQRARRFVRGHRQHRQACIASGPGFEKSGSFESEVLDAGSFAYWGRISYRGSGKFPCSRAAEISIIRRATGVLGRQLAADATANAVRFLRRRARRFSLRSVPAIQDRIDLIGRYAGARGLLRRNRLPAEERRSRGGGGRSHFAQLSLPQTHGSPPAPSNTITLPPLGQQRRSSSPVLLESESSQTLNYAKGYIGARWSASDENGDSLVYKVEIRGVKESSWSC